jgi:hypothetical protein
MPINFGLSASAVGNALTITMTQASGSAPTSTNPVLIPFRSITATAGTVTWTAITATQSITVPSGATLGASNGVPFRVWIFEEYNGGVPELAVATCSNATTVFPCSAWEYSLPTSTTIGGSSNTGGVLYATTGVAADAVRIIGYCNFSSGLATAGTWASSCTALQTFGPGIKKPGDVVQEVQGTTSSATVCGSNTQTSLSAPIVPSSHIDLIEVDADWEAKIQNGGTSGAVTLRLSRGATPTYFGSEGLLSLNVSSSNILSVSGHMSGIDAPATISSITYYIYTLGCAGTSSFNGDTVPLYIRLKEIMG